jgi:hypothetical protein
MMGTLFVCSESFGDSMDYRSIGRPHPDYAVDLAAIKRNMGPDALPSRLKSAERVGCCVWRCYTRVVTLHSISREPLVGNIDT